MPDPAVEAAQRALAGMPLLAESAAMQPILDALITDAGTNGAREVLKPLQAEFGHLQRFARDVGPSDLGRGMQYVLDRIAPLIYPTEELA